MPFPLRSTDALFRRYCRTGDPRALAAVFDRTAPELLRIAGWLSGNRADAEDLLQRTFLLAIEARATFDATQRALPWLGGILGNQARNLKREKARRAAMVRAGEAVRGPLAAAADAEFAAAVAAARQDLSSPYREVLELHLEQGLNAKEIAARLERPAGTVRTQLVRALELLRRRLPSGFVAGLAPLLPEAGSLTATKATVMAAAKAAMPVAGAAGAATTAMAIGGVVVAKKTMLVVPALALLLGVGIYASWPSAEPAPQTPSAQPTAAIAAVERAARAPDAASAVASPPDRQLVPAAALDDADPGFASLRVTVKWSDDGAPATGVWVRALDPENRRRLLHREVVTDEHGVADLRHLAPGKWWVLSSHGGDSQLELRADQRETLELRARRTCAVRGRVVDPEGRPVDQASVWSTQEGCQDESYLAASTDAGGWFSLPLQQQHWLIARKDGFASSYLHSVKGEAGADLEVVLPLRARGGSLRGRVIDARGRPIQWARILVGSLSSYFSTRDRYFPRGEEMVTGRDGTFVATGVAAEPTDVLVMAPGHGLWRDRVAVEAGGSRELTIRLEDGARVQGVVRDGEGQPIAGASIAFAYDAVVARATLWTVADDAGRFGLAELPAGEVELRARAKELRARATLLLRAGATTEWNPVLGKGKGIQGTVLDPDGHPLADVMVGFVEPPYVDPSRFSTTGTDGRFELTNVGDRPVEVEVQRAGALMRLLQGVTPGTTDLVVQLTASDLPTAHLRGRVVDAEGNSVAASVTAMPRSRRSRTTASQFTDPATGAFVCGPLPADSYCVTVNASELGSVHLGTIDLAPGQDRQLGEVVLRERGSASFTVLDLEGNGADSLLLVCTADGHSLDYATLERGHASLPILQPGRYFATCYLDGQDASAEFEVRGGANVEVAIQARPAVPVLLRVCDPVPGAEAVRVDVVVRRPDGTLARALTTQVTPDPCTTQLQPGSYRLDCRAADGRCVQQALVIRSLDERPELTIDLPQR